MPKKRSPVEEFDELIPSAVSAIKDCLEDRRASTAGARMAAAKLVCAYRWGLPVPMHSKAELRRAVRQVLPQELMKMSRAEFIETMNDRNMGYSDWIKQASDMTDEDWDRMRMGRLDS